MFIAANKIVKWFIIKKFQFVFKKIVFNHKMKNNFCQIPNLHPLLTPHNPHTLFPRPKPNKFHTPSHFELAILTHNTQ